MLEYLHFPERVMNVLFGNLDIVFLDCRKIVPDDRRNNGRRYAAIQQICCQGAAETIEADHTCFILPARE